MILECKNVFVKYRKQPLEEILMMKDYIMPLYKVKKKLDKLGGGQINILIV